MTKLVLQAMFTGALIQFVNLKVFKKTYEESMVLIQFSTNEETCMLADNHKRAELYFLGNRQNLAITGYEI